VTDRLALADASGLPDPRAALLDQVKAAVEAGVDFVQLRERDIEAKALAGLTRQCVEAARGSRTAILVNDRLDVALAAGADGVHMRGDSIDPARVRGALPSLVSARRGGPGEGRSFVVGASIRSPDEAEQRVADYLVFGTVYPTPSKPGLERAAGLAGLSRAVRATDTPVLAIGGITEERLEAVARAGAAGVAAIRLFFPGPRGWRDLPARVASWRRRFDTTGSIT
jgi:thiamine-phosphate pyrophosphorylase